MFTSFNILTLFSLWDVNFLGKSNKAVCEKLLMHGLVLQETFEKDRALSSILLNRVLSRYFRDFHNIFSAGCLDVTQLKGNLFIIIFLLPASNLPNTYFIM